MHSNSSSQRLAKVLPFLLVAAAALLHRMVTLLDPSTGGDVLLHWYLAKQIVLGMPLESLGYRAALWPLIGPAVLSAWVFGFDALGYYFFPLLLSTALSVLLYWYLARLVPALIALLAVYALNTQPVFIKSASQLGPEVLSVLLVFLTAIFLVAAESSERSKKNILAGVCYSLALILAPANLVFLPGVLLVLFGLSDRSSTQKGCRCILAVALSLLLQLGFIWAALGIAPWHYYAAFVSYAASLVSQEFSWFALFERLLILKPRFAAVVSIATVFAMISLFRSREFSIRVIAAFWLSFLGGLTFGIFSVSPLVLAIPIVASYWVLGAPFAFALCALAVGVALKKITLQIGVLQFAKVTVVLEICFVLLWFDFSLSRIENFSSRVTRLSALRSQVSQLYDEGASFIVPGMQWRTLAIGLSQFLLREQSDDGRLLPISLPLQARSLPSKQRTWALTCKAAASAQPCDLNRAYRLHRSPYRLEAISPRLRETLEATEFNPNPEFSKRKKSS